MKKLTQEALIGQEWLGWKKKEKEEENWSNLVFQLIMELILGNDLECSEGTSSIFSEGEVS